MTKIKTFSIMFSLFMALFCLDRWGLFKNPVVGTVIIILIVLGLPIAWQINEYVKKKYSKVILTKCPFCGLEMPKDPTHVHNCEVVDEFEEDIKEKKICPYCKLKELETIYEISRGYREVCASCGKSRVSRKALKFCFFILVYIVVILIMFYIYVQQGVK
jgi:hypothetical protein